MMSEIKASKFVVKGRVQGVGYRWFVVSQAEALNLTGTVKNLPDGSVEVFAQGAIDSLFKLRELLNKGPSFSRVDQVLQTDDVINTKIKEFRVIY